MLIIYFSFAVVHEPEGPTPDSQYEHSSLPATVKKIFNLKDDFLTARDAWAGTFEHVVSHRKSPRTDCPSMIPKLLYFLVVFLALGSTMTLNFEICVDHSNKQVIRSMYLITFFLLCSGDTERTVVVAPLTIQ